MALQVRFQHVIPELRAAPYDHALPTGTVMTQKQLAICVFVTSTIACNYCLIEISLVLIGHGRQPYQR